MHRSKYQLRCSNLLTQLFNTKTFSRPTLRASLLFVCLFSFLFSFFINIRGPEKHKQAYIYRRKSKEPCDIITMFRIQARIFPASRKLSFPLVSFTSAQVCLRHEGCQLITVFCRGAINKPMFMSGITYILHTKKLLLSFFFFFFFRFHIKSSYFGIVY